MENKFFARLRALSRRQILISAVVLIALVAVLTGVALKYINPAPPNHLTITTGEAESEYDAYAKLYQDILKEDGIKLEIRPSSGAMENLKRLEDPNSGVDIGFVQDGLGSVESAPDLSSLGSLFYEPIWVFYPSQKSISHFAAFVGKKIAIGKAGGGTQVLAKKLLETAKINSKNSTLLELGWEDSYAALKKHQIDFGFFLGTAQDPLIHQMLEDPALKLMDMSQAEAITRQLPLLHHLVLPQGTIDVQKDIPPQDTHLLSSTVTLLAKDTVHPALIYLMLKAASEIHSDPGIFEKRHEFPAEKDDQFPLNDQAKHYYQSGTPFWQRYLPFWLATLVERFILVVIPVIAVILPLVRMIPKFFEWRTRNKIYRFYGELKHLETKLLAGSHANVNPSSVIKELDSIEKKVRAMKLPLDFSNDHYGLREHIDFVRKKVSDSN